jgi:hypothetical protein
MERKRKEKTMARNKDKWNEGRRKTGIRKERNGIKKKEIRISHCSPDSLCIPL